MDVDNVISSMTREQFDELYSEYIEANESYLIADCCRSGDRTISCDSVDCECESMSGTSYGHGYTYYCKNK
ncbi:hypothetical protein IJ182_01305 [bacterium]|nr:hypothetical protein [bacterium]